MALQDKIKIDLLKALKTHKGYRSTQLSELLGYRRDDVTRALNNLRNHRLVYSTPALKNNAHEWHLNAKDVGSIKYMITSQVWDGSLNLNKQAGGIR